MSIVADISRTSFPGSRESKTPSWTSSNTANDTKHRAIGKGFSNPPASEPHHKTPPNTWTEQVKAALSHLPHYLPDRFPIHKIPIVRDYALKFIMPWVFRDPAVESFDSEVFIQKGYKVTRIANNKNIKGEKYLIMPKNLDHCLEPLIIIHGARTSARSLGGCTQAALDQGHPVIIGDIAGFGASKDSFNLSTIERDIRGMFDFAQQRFKQPFSILAHSFGTYNAAEALKGFLKDNPNAQINDLILISPWDNLYKVTQDLWQIDAKGEKGIETILHEVNDTHAKNALSSLSEAQLKLVERFAHTEAVFQSLKEDLGEQRLSQTIARIGIVYGSDDKHVFPARSLALAELLRGLGLTVKELELKGAGHYDATSQNTTQSAKQIFREFK